MQKKNPLLVLALCTVIGILAALNGGTPWGP